MATAPPVLPPVQNSDGAHFEAPATDIAYKDSDAHALWAAVSVMLGILVAVLGIFAVMMWLDAHNAKDAANSAAAKVTKAAAATGLDGMNMDANLGSLTSYAGAAPADADALATAHTPFPATLPAAPAGPVAAVKLVLTDLTVEIAPGVKYAAWAWAGGAPGPVIHVRQGQQVKI